MTEDTSPNMGAMFGGQVNRGLFDLPMGEIGDMQVEGQGDADIVVVGAPSATPYSSVGPYCADAPKAIRSAFGWPGVLQHHDFDLGGKILLEQTSAIDWGDLPYSETDFANNRSHIRHCVSTILAHGAVPIVIDGDDSIPIPVFQAYEQHAPITILQLDAHIDWRDEVAGERFGLSSNMRRASEMKWVDRLIQVGARGLGSARPTDYADAIKWGVKFFPMIDLIDSNMDEMLLGIEPGSRVFITLDIDVMDPAVVPSVIGPAPGGFDYWRLIKVLTRVAHRARIAGFNLVEFMPANDVGGRGALVAARVLAVMMGLISRQRHQ